MATTQNQLVTIDESSDGDRKYILQRLNNDKFVSTGKQIIEAADLSMGIEAWRSNLADLYVDAHTMAKKFVDRVADVRLIPRHGTVHLIFVTVGSEFDFNLADELATLNIRLRRELQTYGEVEASQIPETELSQFISDDEQSERHN